jgi:nickel-dependent lactate racemase
MLSPDDLRRTLADALAGTHARRILLIHPDYSRNDFCALLVPLLYDQLRDRGLERLDTLNAGGTHRAMSAEELRAKLGLDRERHPLLGEMANHHYADPASLMVAGTIPAAFVAEKTAGHLDEPLTVTVNRMVADDYDLVIALSGTVPHEALGYSGGTKILFPGISGPGVIALLHWAAVLMGIPRLIGTLDNPARDVVNAGARFIFDLVRRPMLALNMVYTEDENHAAVPRGLFAGWGPAGFADALRRAADLSSRLHVHYLDEAVNVAVQRIPAMYDEVWTAGKGSYKLQRPGVLAAGGEIVLFAPHIHQFHSDPELDAAIRAIGYHGLDYVVEYLRRHPGFNRNVAAHVINVRGVGSLANGVERFDFRVTLASQISERDCAAVGLGYRDRDSVRAEDYRGQGKLWIEEGGQWLYARRSP